MADSEYWLELMEAGKLRFPEEFKESEYSSDAPKLGVALSHEWTPQPLRVDFWLLENSDIPFVKLLECKYSAFQIRRSLMEFAQGNATLLLGSAVKKIQGRLESKVHADERMNSLSIYGPLFPHAESLRRAESIQWFLDGFQVFRDLLKPRLIEEFNKLSSD